MTNNREHSRATRGVAASGMTGTLLVLSKSIIKIAALPLVLGISCAALCIVASGQDALGTCLGSITLTACIIPPLIAGERNGWTNALIAGAVVDGVAVIWLVRIFSLHINLSQWLACYIVLLAFGAALIGLTRTIGAASTIVLAMAWLTWPVWLTPHISGGVAAWLTPAHPLLAINHVLLDHGVWTQQRLMYQFSALGQDVPYVLPSTIWPCVILHLLVAGPALWRGKSKGSSSGPASMSAAAEC